MRRGWIGTIIVFLKWISVPLVFMYLYSMVIFPFIDGGWNWSHVHRVWMDWQALNVGMLAFTSSIIALYASQYRVKQQRKSEFIAARSFLPEALSELISYFELSADFLMDVWHKGDALEEYLNHRNEKVPEFNHTPELTGNYREVFSRCISLAEEDIAQHLSQILMRLQIHHARVTDLDKNLHSDDIRSEIKSEVISSLYDLAELYVLVEGIFKFARSIEGFTDTLLDWPKFWQAYRNLNIPFEDINLNRTLEEFTKNRVSG